ncbi:hypothetical protein B0H14DRAFT_3515757 [Mycena olivaceomarginata]|nr:hypothetical protein B0H14DRAFT_3515757 [Mycena olivaceomarginata]
MLILLGINIVRARLQNITVDNTSPDIIYGGQIFQCNADTCPDDLTARLSKNSVTITNGTIRFSFAGTAFYASLAIVGHVEATVNGDTQNLNISVLDVIPGGGYFEIWQSNMPNASHILSIVPESDRTLIGLDHLVYTTLALDKKSHVGAIVGGVIGGVVLILGILFVAMFARRRKLILRRNRRKSVVLSQNLDEMIANNDISSPRSGSDGDAVDGDETT